MSETIDTAASPTVRKDRTHWLYIAVVVAVVLGVLVGWLAPDLGKELKVLGTSFVNLIKMMISPVIFCTIVLGIGSVRKAASVGRVGGARARLLHRHVDLRPRDRPGRRQPHPPGAGPGHPHDVQGAGRR